MPNAEKQTNALQCESASILEPCLKTPNSNIILDYVLDNSLEVPPGQEATEHESIDPGEENKLNEMMEDAEKQCESASSYDPCCKKRKSEDPDSVLGDSLEALQQQETLQKESSICKNDKQDETLTEMESLGVLEMLNAEKQTNALQCESASILEPCLKTPNSNVILDYVLDNSLEVPPGQEATKNESIDPGEENKLNEMMENAEKQCESASSYEPCCKKRKSEDPDSVLGDGLEALQQQETLQKESSICKSGKQDETLTEMESFGVLEMLNAEKQTNALQCESASILEPCLKTPNSNVILDYVLDNSLEVPPGQEATENESIDPGEENKLNEMMEDAEKQCESASSYEPCCKKRKSEDPDSVLGDSLEALQQQETLQKESSICKSGKQDETLTEMESFGVLEMPNAEKQTNALQCESASILEPCLKTPNSNVILDYVLDNSLEVPPGQEATEIESIDPGEENKLNEMLEDAEKQCESASSYEPCFKKRKSEDPDSVLGDSLEALQQQETLQKESSICKNDKQDETLTEMEGFGVLEEDTGKQCERASSYVPCCKKLKYEVPDSVVVDSLEALQQKETLQKEPSIYKNDKQDETLTEMESLGVLKVSDVNNSTLLVQDAEKMNLLECEIELQSESSSKSERPGEALSLDEPPDLDTFSPKRLRREESFHLPVSKTLGQHPVVDTFENAPIKTGSLAFSKDENIEKSDENTNADVLKTIEDNSSVSVNTESSNFVTENTSCIQLEETCQLPTRSVKPDSEKSGNSASSEATQTENEMDTYKTRGVFIGPLCRSDQRERESGKLSNSYSIKETAVNMSSTLFHITTEKIAEDSKCDEKVEIDNELSQFYKELEQLEEEDPMENPEESKESASDFQNKCEISNSYCKTDSTLDAGKAKKPVSKYGQSSWKAMQQDDGCQQSRFWNTLTSPSWSSWQQEETYSFPRGQTFPAYNHNPNYHPYPTSTYGPTVGATANSYNSPYPASYTPVSNSYNASTYPMTNITPASSSAYSSNYNNPTYHGSTVPSTGHAFGMASMFPPTNSGTYLNAPPPASSFPPPASPFQPQFGPLPPPVGLLPPHHPPVGPLPPHHPPVGPLPPHPPPVGQLPPHPPPVGPLPPHPPPVGPLPPHPPPLGPLPAHPPPVGPLPRHPFTVGPLPRHPFTVGPLPRHPPPVGPLPRQPLPVGPLPRHPPPVGPLPRHPPPVGPLPRHPPPVGPLPPHPPPVGPLPPHPPPVGPLPPHPPPVGPLPPHPPPVGPLPPHPPPVGPLPPHPPPVGPLPPLPPPVGPLPPPPVGLLPPPVQPLPPPVQPLPPPVQPLPPPVQPLPPPVRVLPPTSQPHPPPVGPLLPLKRPQPPLESTLLLQPGSLPSLVSSLLLPPPPPPPSPPPPPASDSLPPSSGMSSFPTSPSSFPRPSPSVLDASSTSSPSESSLSSHSKELGPPAATINSASTLAPPCKTPFSNASCHKLSTQSADISQPECDFPVPSHKVPIDTSHSANEGHHQYLDTSDPMRTLATSVNTSNPSVRQPAPISPSSRSESPTDVKHPIINSPEIGLLPDAGTFPPPTNVPPCGLSQQVDGFPLSEFGPPPTVPQLAGNVSPPSSENSPKTLSPNCSLSSPKLRAPAGTPPPTGNFITPRNGRPLNSLNVESISSSPNHSITPNTKCLAGNFLLERSVSPTNKTFVANCVPLSSYRASNDALNEENNLPSSRDRPRTASPQITDEIFSHGNCPSNDAQHSPNDFSPSDRQSPAQDDFSLLRYQPNNSEFESIDDFISKHGCSKDKSHQANDYTFSRSHDTNDTFGLEKDFRHSRCRSSHAAPYSDDFSQNYSPPNHSPHADKNVSSSRYCPSSYAPNFGKDFPSSKFGLVNDEPPFEDYFSSYRYKPNHKPEGENCYPFSRHRLSNDSPNSADDFTPFTYGSLKDKPLLAQDLPRSKYEFPDDSSCSPSRFAPSKRGNSPNEEILSRCRTPSNKCFPSKNERYLHSPDYSSTSPLPSNRYEGYDERNISSKWDYPDTFENVESCAEKTNCRLTDRKNRDIDPINEGRHKKNAYRRDGRTGRHHGEKHQVSSNSVHKKNAKRKVLVLLRGVPGSGKSTLARDLLDQNSNGVIFSTDDFFRQQDGYSFVGKQLGNAHEWNQQRST